METDNEELIETDAYQDSIVAVIIGLLIIGGGTFIGFVWLLILSIIRG